MTTSSSHPQIPLHRQVPDAHGFFGKFGGSFIPPQLQKEMDEIDRAYQRVCRSYDFIRELRSIRKHFQGRPTPVYYCKNLSEKIDGARIYLKREDLNHSGAHKLNHCMGEALLA
ncbi:MAG: tryptophan synthase subunit beta, partial [Burkholderiaceae bacterium]|nr:tryptophan synthase subunit beta [Burkholderiaceae bacterium]